MPKDAPAARNVELALKVPDGWTATTDDTTRFARVRPGDTVTADYTVTPPADPVHYAVLSATAKLDPDRPSGHRHRCSGPCRCRRRGCPPTPM